MLTGTYEQDSEVGDRLLRALPGSLVLRADEWDSPFALSAAFKRVRGISPQRYRQAAA